MQLQQDQPTAVTLLPINNIRPNPYQPRRHMDAHALEELAESIRQYGLLQPITVRKTSGRFYELVAGERRLRAARMAGLEQVPALVRHAWEQQAAVLALVENLQREQLHYLEEAEGYINLAQEHGLSQEEIAQRVGKSQPAVANKMRLMRLPAALRTQLAQHGVPERQARVLLRLPTPELQQQALKAMVERGLTAREAEALAERLLHPAAPPAPTPQNRQIKRLFRDYRLLTNSLKATVKDFRAAGLLADYNEQDTGDAITVTLVLPKSQAAQAPVALPPPSVAS